MVFRPSRFDQSSHEKYFVDVVGSGLLSFRGGQTIVGPPPRPERLSPTTSFQPDVYLPHCYSVDPCAAPLDNSHASESLSNSLRRHDTPKILRVNSMKRPKHPKTMRTPATDPRRN